MGEEGGKEVERQKWQPEFGNQKSTKSNRHSPGSSTRRRSFALVPAPSGSSLAVAAAVATAVLAWEYWSRSGSIRTMRTTAQRPRRQKPTENESRIRFSVYELSIVTPRTDSTASPVASAPKGHCNNVPAEKEERGGWEKRGEGVWRLIVGLEQPLHPCRNATV